MKKVVRTRQNCITIAKKIALKRDKYQCLWCGKSKEAGWQIHGSHIKGQGAYPNLSYNPKNIKALCASCHMRWHSSPIDGADWLSSKYPDWYKEIQEMAKEPVGKHDYNVIFEKLCQELVRLQ
jgi:5-methylcytosine-specific restriction endonuclease McrA